MPSPSNRSLEELVGRSHRLGSDPRNTNYGGGNTSVKAEMADVFGDDREVLLVKGSGGDLGTLTPEGMAALDLVAMKRLPDLYRGEQHEDEMFELVAHCAMQGWRAAPSIDTAMHGLLPLPHVDHLHPDSVIALAASVDGEQLTKECYGDEVGWVPWRRPGFELALQINGLYEKNPELRGVVLGGHGLTSWGHTSERCEANTLDLIARAARFIDERGRPDPFGARRPGYEPLPESERRRRAAALAPHIRGLASHDTRTVGHFRDDDLIIHFLSRDAAPRLVELGTTCPDHFLRSKVRPLLLDLPSSVDLDEQIEELHRLHAQYRKYYEEYYLRHATEADPPMRGADPALFLVPGVGMFSFGVDKQTARVAGEYYVNAINVMRGAEALSRYTSISDAEKFRIEYWSLEEAKLRRRPAPKPLAGKVALVTGAGSGIGRAVATRLGQAGALVVCCDRAAEPARQTAGEAGGDAISVASDVCDEAQVQDAFDQACLTFGGVDIVVQSAGLSISKPLSETDVADWDALHDVLARGSFLISRAAARVLRAQGHGGDIVYVVSKNAVLAGSENVAYAAAKADQAHQVRLLAAELGNIGVRVNGVNPDGVVAGSGIFEGEWGDQRAAVYGVPRDKLGEFYAQRTLLKKEVLPEHVADAVYALVSGYLQLTTGTHIPVDGGIPGAFLR